MTKKHSEDASSKEPEKASEADVPSEQGVTLTRAQHEALVAEAKEHKDRYLRILAEFENARKRQERERQEFIRYANEGLILDFLHIVDDLERTVSAARQRHEDDESFIKGIEMVLGRVHELLKKQGVTPIECQGKMFDPHSHEVLMQEPRTDCESGTVVEELQKGYRLGERVVRTAKVKVAMAPAGARDAGGPGDEAASLENE